MPAPSYVDEMLADARLVAEFMAAIDGRLNSKLVAAIDAVERLPVEGRTLISPEVVNLGAVYEIAREKVPFRQFYALRNGWRVFPSRRQRTWTALMVIGAILFMICTLHLTRIYNRGVELSDALATLEQSEAEIRYGELERRLLDAQEQLEPSTKPARGAATAGEGEGTQVEVVPPRGPALGTEQFLLAREASYRLLNELVNLDQKVKTVTTQVGRFQYQSRYPLIGQQTVESYFLRLSGALQGLNSFLSSCPFGVEKDGKCAYGGGRTDGAQSDETKSGDGKATETQQTNARQDPTGYGYTVIFDPRIVGMRETFCGKVELLEQYAQGKLSKSELTRRDWFIGQLTYSLDKSLGVDTAAAIVRSCALGLNFYSGAFPDIEALNMEVTDTLNLYSLIILPAVYGALGAIVYFLRAFLNPQEPNEGWSRTVYRVALGALAGMIMAWLGMGLLGTDEAFKSIGLGLFAFAFILGFSIDVFFDLLENLVKAARRTVGQIGAPDPGQAAPNQPAGPTGGKGGSGPGGDDRGGAAPVAGAGPAGPGANVQPAGIG